MIANISGTEAKRGKSRKVVAVLLMRTAMVAPSLLIGSQAYAQEAGEIVVTAQRREQAVIDVPISVSVLDDRAVNSLNLSTVSSVGQQVPNFNITFSRGSSATPDLSIRGVRGEGSNARINESSVAVYVDDVYLGDESSLSGQMFDVARIEVLRGPQGTLFGRNTTGGLVQIVSAAPTSEFSGRASVLYGSDNWVLMNGAISGGFGEKVRSRLAGQFEQHDGHFNNRATLPGAPRKLAAKKAWSIRSTTDFDVGDVSKLRLQITQSETDAETTPNYGLGIWKNQAGPRVLCSREEIFAARCADSIVLGGQPPQNGRRAGDAITELSRDDLAVRQNLTSLTAKFETEIGSASLINIGNYTQFKSRIGIDGDASSTPSTLVSRVLVELENSTEQYSNELRIQGSSTQFDWVAGIFYYQDKKKNANFLNVRTDAGVTAVRIPSNSRVDTKSGAAFGQVDWRFAEQWTLTVGGRYTIENRELKEARVGPNNILPSIGDPDPVTKDVTGRVSLTWEPTPDNSIYASYSRGAKSVAYSTFYTNPAPAAIPSNAALTGPVGQEHVDAFEIGSKNRLLDRTLMVNLSAFFYNFDGKQELLSVADNSSGVPILSTQFLNVGKAEIYGAELELNYAPSERWDFNVSGGLLKTKITKSDIILNSPRLGLVPLQGRPIPQTPKWTLNATVAYHIPVEGAGIFTIQPEGRAQAKQNFVLSNDPLVDVPSYGVVNFRLLWESPSKMYNAQAFVTNAFNKAYFNRINDTNAPAGSLITQQAEPRVFGAKFGVSF